MYQHIAGLSDEPSRAREVAEALIAGREIHLPPSASTLPVGAVVLVPIVDGARAIERRPDTALGGHWRDRYGNAFTDAEIDVFLVRGAPVTGPVIAGRHDPHCPACEADEHYCPLCRDAVNCGHAHEPVPAH